MIKQLIIPLIAVAAFVVLVGIFTQKGGDLKLAGLITTPTPAPSKMITVGSKEIEIEIADTAALRSKGLSSRNTLAENRGMLFVFDSKKTTPSFWMKDMIVSLDIIWITDGKVAKIDKDVPTPAPNTPDNKLRIYSPGKPTDYVLEVNAGFTQKNGIKVGDEIILPTL
jgi:hypothetical protein